MADNVRYCPMSKPSWQPYNSLSTLSVKENRCADVAKSIRLTHGYVAVLTYWVSDREKVVSDREKVVND